MRPVIFNHKQYDPGYLVILTFIQGIFNPPVGVTASGRALATLGLNSKVTANQGPKLPRALSACRRSFSGGTIRQSVEEALLWSLIPFN